jgi:hypothetical protein
MTRPNGKLAHLKSFEAAYLGYGQRVRTMSQSGSKADFAPRPRLLFYLQHQTSTAKTAFGGRKARKLRRAKPNHAVSFHSMSTHIIAQVRSFAVYSGARSLLGL